MKNIGCPLLLLVLSLFSCKSIEGEEGSRVPLQDTTLDWKFNTWLETKIDSTMSVNNVPALSIGIISDGKLIYSRGFGVYERGSSKKVDENSVYQIGSDTKKFTAIIVRNLLAEGKLELEESILFYLPDILNVETREKLEEIDVTELLLHRSGLPFRAPSNKRIDGEAMIIPYTEQDLLTDLSLSQLQFEPGTDFGYSNFGYAVLGFIAEAASGNNYSDLLEKYVTDKYDMPNTFIRPNPKQFHLIVTPYKKEDRTESQPWKMGKMAPAGGIYSNINDLSKLMIAQIEAYKEYNESGDTGNPLILTETDGIKDSHYGFGLAKTIDKKTGTRYGHGGDLDGYASGYVFSPEKSLGLILLTSSGGSWIGSLETEIRKKLSF